MESVTDIQFIDALVDRCGNDNHKAAFKAIRKELEEISKTPDNRAKSTICPRCGGSGIDPEGHGISSCRVCVRRDKQ